MSAEKPKEVEKMIAQVEKKKELTRAQAIDYMLGVATGRLAALWRYDKSIPEGKTSKGILTVAGKKKRAEKSARISVLPESHQPASRAAAAEKPAKKPAKKAAKKRRSPAKKRAKKEGSEDQLIIEGAAE